MYNTQNRAIDVKMGLLFIQFRSNNAKLVQLSIDIGT